jgi:hypothetical protein
LAYIGVQPADAYTSFAVQHFTTSATDTFTLDFPVANENEIALFINNVRQEPGSSYAYTASGTTLTLASAITGSDSMYCVFIGKAVQTVTPAVGSVTGSMMSYPLTNFSSTGIDDNGTSTAITIDSSQNVGIGESSPDTKLHVKAGSSGTETAFADSVITLENSGNSRLQFLSGNTSQGEIMFGDGDSNRQGRITYDHSDNSLRLQTTNAERMRIDNQGSVLINNLATPHDQNVNPGFKVYGTGSGATVLGLVSIARYQGEPLILNRVNNDGRLIGLQGQGVTRGQIAVSGTVIQYTSYSDHRLKEDVQQISNATESLKQLNPVNFAWIDGGVRMNGFLAHEVQSVVPEAVTGTHNEVDSDDNPVYQGIDQSKLVPLLTASLQEAIAKIEELETRIATLENA